MENQIKGAIKIKDGLFIGDEFAAKDFEFTSSNKVTHIINCSGRQVENVFENIGIKYLVFNWMETDSQILFEDKNLEEIYDFIEECHAQGESCLVHSFKGQSRSCCALTAFLMKKYRWTLYKTLEYLNSRRPDLEIRASFFHQLTALEAKLQRQGIGARSSTWEDTINDINSEDLVLRNTFLNSKCAEVADIFIDQHAQYQILQQPYNKVLKWPDNQFDDNLKPKCQVIEYEEYLKPKMAICNKIYIKSVLKGSKKLQKVGLSEQSSSTSNLCNQNQKFSLKSAKSVKNLIDDDKQLKKQQPKPPQNFTRQMNNYLQTDDNFRSKLEKNEQKLGRSATQYEKGPLDQKLKNISMRSNSQQKKEEEVKPQTIRHSSAQQKEKKDEYIIFKPEVNLNISQNHDGIFNQNNIKDLKKQKNEMKKCGSNKENLQEQKIEKKSVQMQVVIDEQVDQINKISNNLMKSILNFQPQTSSNKQIQQNINQFIKGGPVRATEKIPSVHLAQQDQNNSFSKKINQPVVSNNSRQFSPANLQYKEKQKQQRLNSFSPSQGNNGHTNKNKDLNFNYKQINLHCNKEDVSLFTLNSLNVGSATGGYKPKWKF